MMGNKNEWMTKAVRKERDRMAGQEGQTLMPQHEEISLLLFVDCFHRIDDPVNPSSVAEKSLPPGDISLTPLTSTQ